MPKKVDHRQRRDEFTQAAIAVIAEKGLDGARLVDVARFAGVTTGSLTHYFNDKDQLIAAALDYVIEKSSHQIGDESTSLLSALAAFLPLDEDGHAAARVWLAFFGHAIGRETLANVHRQYYAEFVESLTRLLRKHPALTPECSDPLELTMTVDLLIALVDGLLVRAALDPDAWPAQRQIQHLEKGIRALCPQLIEIEIFSEESQS